VFAGQKILPVRIARVEFFNRVELFNAFSAKTQLDRSPSQAYLIQTAQLTGGLFLCEIGLSIAFPRGSAGVAISERENLMATKKRAGKSAKRGNTLRWVKELEKTKPLEWIKASFG